MIVPEFWAEARLPGKVGKRQLVVRRFGWSDAGEAEARAMAEERAAAALARIQSGEKLGTREIKSAYNGSDGVPIREQIVARHGDAVVTRNLYGARCLNTPDVLFADVDFDFSRVGRIALSTAFGSMFAAFVAAWIAGLRGWLLAVVTVAPAFVVHRIARAVAGWWLRRSGGEESVARKRIDDFAATHSAWHLRVYRTPAGFRVMALHRTFDPAEPEVALFFAALGTDPVYARMCVRQHCFRARVSPKPWRVGIEKHIRPRPGVWPVKPERRPERDRWIEEYERVSAGFAACRYVASIGSGGTDPAALAVQRVHDELCRADTELPIA